MLKRLPLWMAFAGAAWMAVAIRLFAMRKIALRLIMVTNYLGFRTGLMLPLVSREPSIWDVWILNAWMVLTGTVEFALLGFLLRFAIRQFFLRPSPTPLTGKV
jgi:hypothetical protein